jgi:hypothetical protein
LIQATRLLGCRQSTHSKTTPSASNALKIMPEEVM